MGRRRLILSEGLSGDPVYGKTGRGVLRYRPDEVAAVVDSARAGAREAGVPVVASVAEGLAFGPTEALVGVAPVGGRLPGPLRAHVEAALRAGLAVEAGMHEFLADDPALAALAAAHGAGLRDLRRPPAGLGVTTGGNLEHPARVVLTVGSDCAIGKMTATLELDAAARRRGLASVFVPTGQTGIAIAGWGIAVDAVVADFLGGAAERLVLDGVARGGELLWVEGQGALLHPQYSGVTLGLYHGSAPHALVLCHQAGAAHLEGLPAHPIPPLAELVRLHERVALPARPARVLAVAVNTRGLGEDDARAAVAAAQEETGLVAGDPVRFGAERLLAAVLEGLEAGGT